VTDRALFTVVGCKSARSVGIYGMNADGREERTGFREEELIDDDIMRINLVCCQFLNKSFRLVER
jgi:hypothetical protein